MPVEIQELYGIESAVKARGHVVVIDVLRAFSTAAYAFASGAESIVLVREPQEALALKQKDPTLILVGEVQGQPIPGFDFGNSPAAIRKTPLEGKRLVLRSSSGTQGVAGAAFAERILLGSLVVAKATSRWLIKSGAPTVSLLAMGSNTMADREEDLACSAYIASLLRSDPLPAQDVAGLVRASPAAQRALDPAVDWISPEDLDCAAAVDAFDFAMPVRRERNLLVARAEPA